VFYKAVPAQYVSNPVGLPSSYCVKNIHSLKINMRFGTWNVRNLYRAGSLMTVASKITKYKFDLVGVQEVRWDRGGKEPAGEYSFFYGKGNENKYN
jgi:hypothetical protein